MYSTVLDDIGTVTYDMEIKCANCSQNISHTCNSDALKAAVAMMKWVPEWSNDGVCEALEKIGRETGWLDPDQKLSESRVFGSQAWTYTLFGKENARTFHALLNSLIRASGLDPNQVLELAWEDETE